MVVSLKDKAYEMIKSKIINCEYQPNTFLNENFLMQEIDASRTPIREALNKLEQEGLVQIFPKRGVAVSGLSLTEVNQTFEARLLLEPYIVTNYMDAIDTDKLTSILEKTRLLIEGEPEHREFCRLDDLLHRVICDASPNKYINEILEHIYDQNERIRILGGRNIWQRHREAAKEHVQLVDAILAKDKEAAVSIITEHLKRSKDAAIQSLLG